MAHKIVFTDSKSETYTLLHCLDNKHASTGDENISFLDESRINLLDSRAFSQASNWLLLNPTTDTASISNDIRGFEKINSDPILSLYSKDKTEWLNAVNSDEIPLRISNYYKFSIYIATHRSTGTVYIDMLDESKKLVRSVSMEAPLDISGGERLELYKKLSSTFCVGKSEKYCRFRISKSPLLYGDDSFLFLVLPRLSIVSFASDASIVDLPNDLRPYLFNAIMHDEILAVSELSRNEIVVSEDGSAQLAGGKLKVFDSVRLLHLLPDDVIPVTQENPSKFYNRRHSPQKARVKIVIGTVLYNNSDTEIDNLTRRSAISVAFLKDTFQRQNVVAEVECIYIDNSTDKGNSALRMIGWTYIQTSANIGFARGHNLLMNYAFDDISNADYYIMVNPDGFPIERCYYEMVFSALYQYDAGLVEAVQFPIEHPKSFDPVTFESPWCSGACLLVSQKAFLETRGFDENFTMYCEDVDFSWRVKEAKLCIKICPSAIFYHDVRDRSDRSVRRSMLISGRYLGHKWGAHDFVDWVNQLLISEGFYPDKIYIPPLAPNLINRTPDIGEFRQGFYFAIPRW